MVFLGHMSEMVKRWEVARMRYHKRLVPHISPYPLANGHNLPVCADLGCVRNQEIIT